MARTPGRRVGSRPIGRNLAVALLIVAIGAILTFAAVGRALQRSNSAGAGLDSQVALGQRLYAQQCASCHGADLQGQPNWRTPTESGSMPAPPHDLSGHTWHHSDQQLFEITKYGGQRFSAPDYRNAMPAFEDRLSDDEIRAVLAYIKSTWPADIRASQEQQNR
jgi:S-disulfanyl-L-cysteine oxidoreductase SoxD